MGGGGGDMLWFFLKIVKLIIFVSVWLILSFKQHHQNEKIKIIFGNIKTCNSSKNGHVFYIMDITLLKN
jgi:hypothetical protein